MSISPFHCHECYKLRRNVHNGLKVLQEYAWLLNSFVLDFYTENHWKKLPEKWKQILDNVEPEELGKLLDPSNLNGSLQRVWPLSLLALRSASVLLSVSRQQCRHDSFLSEHFEKCPVFPQSSVSESSKTCSLHKVGQFKNCNNSVHSASSPKTSSILQRSELSYVFTKHVKPKKRHEITTMAQVTAETAQASGCQYIVDIGSGMGHLSRMLAYGYGLNVCCLEAQETLSEQARKLDAELEVSVSKRLSPEEMANFHRPVHVNVTIRPQLDTSSFVKDILKAFDKTHETDLKFGLVGLHPCGNLGPILLQLFVNCHNVKFINIVGCCYMKISLDNPLSDHFTGYPLSYFVSERPHTISYEACEIACHAIESYCERLCSGDVNHLKVHCYRATLERLLVKHSPDLRHAGIHSIKHVHLMAFEEYCKAAVSRLGVQLSLEQASCEETLDNLAQWKRVVTLYSLRLMLAPLVETIVLLDRLLYLHERGISSVLIPVFKPSLSPRNHILVATKPV
ncbi:methyltransferase-like protein 25B isoform X3 [Anabrus simplex]|uniref:methyltransferase-like protein 25B isoform X3 n=1 Tax=Anabrus simplex TaxID=316456 RepID=UPI0035A378FA